MRRGASITGPLVLIGIGVLFLIHAISPAFQIGELLAHYWPLILIFWGVAQLIEISIRAATGGPVPLNGISGGGWLLVLFICVAGLISYEVHRSGTWWRHATWSRGVEAFGEQHDYSVAAVQRTVGKTPHIAIESFRGDAKIVATDSDQLTITGHKTVRAFDSAEADRGNAQTPVDVAMQGSTLVIRCHQEQADSRTPVTTDLEISVPKGATIEATGQAGDFDVTGVDGNIDISSENAEVRMQDIHGNVKIDTRRSDLIRCTNMTGDVDLRGHGSDVELAQISGQVTLSGDYTGSVALRQLEKPVRVQNLRTEFEAQQVPGEIRLDRGSLNVENVVGPVHLQTRSTDVTLDGFSNGVELTVDKGDIDLRPGRVPLGKMVVHTRSGNIELSLPQTATFALTASTDHGEVDNQFGEALKQRTEGNSARLEGSVGSGPEVSLTTGRGSITVRKATGEATSKAAVM